MVFFIVMFALTGLGRKIIPGSAEIEMSSSEIHQKYMEARERVIEGRISWNTLAGVFSLLGKQFKNLSPEEHAKKQLSVDYFLKSVGNFLQNQSLFNEQSDNARGLRTILFNKLQKALEVQDDLIATKDLTWKALTED